MKKTKRNRNKRLKKRKTKKHGVGRGLLTSLTTSQRTSLTTFNMERLIKDLLIDNVHNRFVERPEYMREYTIHPGNKDIILEYIRNNEINKETVANPILKPVLSKGSHRIIQLEEFIEKLNRMDNRRAILISQYIILNQVFGDGNHRAGLFVLRKHSSFNEECIEKIMELTEEIHKYEGRLKDKGFWLYDKDQKIFVPSKIDEMFKDYLSQDCYTR
jgi:hypothetical protein